MPFNHAMKKTHHLIVGQKSDIRIPSITLSRPSSPEVASIGLHIQGFTCAGCGETAGETAAISIISCHQIGQILPGRTGTFLKRGRYVSAKNCFLEKLRNSHIDPNGKFQYRSCEHERESRHMIIIFNILFIICHRQNSPFSCLVFQKKKGRSLHHPCISTGVFHWIGPRRWL